MRRSLLLALAVALAALATCSLPPAPCVRLHLLAAGEEVDTGLGPPTVCRAAEDWQGSVEAGDLEVRLSVERPLQTGDLTPITDCDN